MFKAFFFLAFTISTSCLAAEKSDPFFIGITGRVCDTSGKCQRYNGDFANFQIDLFEKAGVKTGTMHIEYEIEGVKVTNSFFLSERDFGGGSQTELYIEIKNSLSPSQVVGVAIVVKTLANLNLISPAGMPFEANGYTIIPELVVGPVVR